jgi:chromosome partitioning protein
MILTVCNLKGGSSKTTSAAYVAHALAEIGRRVLVIDADPQRSISDWAEAGQWTIPVRGMANGQLHDPVVGVAAVEAGAGYDVVVIDTPGTDKHRSIVESAIRAATHVLVPLAPSTIEYGRMAATRQLIDDVSHLGRHGAPPAAAALLTRTVANTVSVAVFREQLVADGWQVVRSTVARREQFAQAWGAPVRDAYATAYGDAMLELHLVAA